MGAPMANNLIQSGHRLVVFDLVESAMQDAVGAGAQRAGSPAEVTAYVGNISSASFPGHPGCTIGVLGM